MLPQSLTRPNPLCRESRPQITSIQDAISSYNANVSRIADLHNRTLNSTDENANQQNTAILDDLIGQTRDLGNSIKQRLQSLEAQPAQPGQDMRIRKNRVRLLRVCPIPQSPTLARRQTLHVPNLLRPCKTTSR